MGAFIVPSFPKGEETTEREIQILEKETLFTFVKKTGPCPF